MCRTKFLTRLKDFVCVPHVKNNKWNGEDWILLTDLSFEYNGKVFIIPAGRVTNFGSIPAICRPFLDTMGKSLRAFVVHDETYSVDGVIEVERREGDEILYQLSLYDNESKADALAINYGLFLGGWTKYKKSKAVLEKPSERVIEYILKCNSKK